jgi:arylsulfatase A-like enzyme
VNRREFLVRAGCTASVLQACSAAPSAGQSRPSIVLIYADDVGYGDIGCYGATEVRTPNLDRIASQGLRFLNAHATAATCTPSRYSLLTGEYAWRKPGTGILPGDASLIIDPGQVTLPSILKGAGYRTGVVGKWHLGLGRGHIDWNGNIQPSPREIGFDYSFLIPATPDRVPCIYVENGRVINLDPNDPISISYEKPFPGEVTGKANPELLKMRPSHGHDNAIVDGVSRIGYMTGGKSALWTDETIVDVLSAKACDFVEQHRHEPFFLYYATHDIHVPRVPNPRFVGSTSMGPRGDAIAELDWSVGQILKKLDAAGLTESTIVLFSSDNGPVLDDGYQDQAVQRIGTHKPAGEYRGGKYSNFDAGTRVPFLIRWPGHIKGGSQSAALISQVDLLHSFAALNKQSLPNRAAPDSFDILPALLGKSEKGREQLVEAADVLSSIEGNWKVIESSNEPPINKNTNTELGNARKPQLYNLASDPGEKHDLAAEQPNRVQAMLKQLDSVRAAGRSRP